MPKLPWEVTLGIGEGLKLNLLHPGGGLSPLTHSPPQKLLSHPGTLGQGSLQQASPSLRRPEC